MYALAGRITPDDTYALAKGTYAEMVKAGITCVGEFDYVHHSEALIAAARETGIRLTLLDACYLAGGFGEPVDRRPGALQRRRRGALGRAGLGRSRARRSAPRSTPSAPSRRDQLDTVVEWAERQAAALPRLRAARRERGLPGRPRRHAGPAAGRARRAGAETRPPSTPPTSPTQDRGCCDETTICMCPTTERDLADGIGDAGPNLSLGSDSHAIIDLFEEARAVELNLRLKTERRGHFTARGAAARRDQPRVASAGTTRAGSSPARSPTSSRSASTRRGWRPPSRTRCSSRSCSPRPPPTSPRRSSAAGRADRQHRHAGHQRPRAGDDQGRGAGLRRRPRRLGGPTRPGARGRRNHPLRRARAGPSSRASSTPTGIWCSRAIAPRSSPRAWRAAPTRAGGIKTTVAATRAASDEQLGANLDRLIARGAAIGHDDGRDEVGLRPDRPRRAPQPRRRAPAHPGDHVPRRPRRPAGARRGRLCRPRQGRDARRLRAPRALDRRLLRDRARSTATRPARSSRPGSPRA